jgi:hypothetical protein
MTTTMDRPIVLPWGRQRRWLASAGRSLRVHENKLTIATVSRGLYQDFIPLRGRAVQLLAA